MAGAIADMGRNFVLAVLILALIMAAMFRSVRDSAIVLLVMPLAIVAGATIGAPPDSFFTAGQNWALPPLSPTASRRQGHRVVDLRPAAEAQGALA